MTTTLQRMSGRSRVWTIGLACGAFLGAGTALASLGPNLPWLAERTAQPLANLGWIFTVFSAGVVLMQISLGFTSSRLGLRGVLALGMALMGGAMVGVTLAQSLTLLLISVGLAGMGFGGILGAGNILVARTFEEHSATALNGVNTFFGLGAIIGPMLVGQTEAWLGMPQIALWLGSSLLIILAIFVIWLIAPPVAETEHVRSRNQGEAVHVWSVWLLGLMLLVYTGTEVGFSGWITVYMQQSTGMVLAKATLVTSAFWLALSAGRLLGAFLGMQINAQRLLFIALIGLVTGASLITVSVGASGPSLVGTLLFGLACGPIFPTVILLITLMARGNSGLAGMALGLGNSGGVILPAMIGLLLTNYGPTAMMSTVLICTLLMLGLGTLAIARAYRT